MTKNYIYTLLIVVIGALLALWLLLSTPHDDGHDNEEHAESENGPNGGRLFQQGGFSLELKVFEKGVPPEFHVYSYYDGKLIDPAEVGLNVEIKRLDGQVDIFNFYPQMGYLRGNGVVTEPHSFDVAITANHKGNNYQWQYENHEGRVHISSAIATMSKIKAEVAAPHMVSERLVLTGRVQTDPNRISHVRARFPGVVKKVHRELGEQVRKGDVMAEIQSNESLQSYVVEAPISGVIVRRDLQVGEATGDAPLYTITDLSKVWVVLDLFDKDLHRVRSGQSVRVETLGGTSFTGKINWLSPLTSHASQSIEVRVVLDNVNQQLKPGQFVRGDITIADHLVPLAVRKSAIQTFRDFQVVFARVDETYEVRMLELGRSDAEWIEVLSGLKTGTEYVVENSYLIKADIEKSGASHDH